MIKYLNSIINASQPLPPPPPAADGEPAELPPHRRDAYPLRVVLTLAIMVSVIVILLRGCAAILP